MFGDIKYTISGGWQTAIPSPQFQVPLRQNGNILNNTTILFDASYTLEDLEKIRLYYLGKKGLIPEALKGFATLSIEEKISKGQELNTTKKFIEAAIKDQKINIENIEISKKITQESIDITLPPNINKQGKIHPISQTIFSIIEIFGN